MRIAIILARGNSVRIKNKNTLMFEKRPMISWPIKCAHRTKIFDRIIVSTDCLKIKKIAEKYNAEVPFLRSKNNSKHNSLPIDAIKEVLSKLKIKNKIYICVFFGNSPFSYYKDVLKGLKLFNKKKIKTVLPVKKIDSRYQRIFVKNKNETIKFFNQSTLNARSQELSDTFIDAGQWFWIKYDTRKSKKFKILGGKIGFVTIPDNRVCDIDNYSDLKLARLLAKKKHFKHA